MNNLQAQASEVRINKLNPLILIEVLEHNPGCTPVKTIIRKTLLDVTTSTFASDDAFGEHISAEEIWIQVIDGNVKIIIDGNINLLNAGDCLTIPANATRQIAPGHKFTLIATNIKTS